MKKISLLSFLVLFVFAIGFAQPTLTSNNFVPLVGESQLFYVADTASVLDNTTGANVIFDYSNLEGFGTTRTIRYVDPTTTEFSSEFSTASYADTTDGVSVSKRYFENKTDSLVNLGLVVNLDMIGKTVGNYSNDPETTMKFPFDFLDSFADNYSGDLSATVSGIPVSSTGEGNVTVNADAWGTLRLPGSLDIDSVLRVVQVESFLTDTIKFPSQLMLPDILPIQISATITNYYKPSINKFPLLSFTSANIGGELTNTVLSQYSLPMITNIPEYTSNVDLSIFPNPSEKGNTTISIGIKNNASVSIDLINSMGQKIKSVFNGNIPQGQKTITMETSNLKKGTYFLKLTVNDELVSRKIVIK